jgi:sulfate permease, SulP family
MRLFASLHSYQRPWLSRDLVAGLTLWGDPGSSGARVREHRERVAGRGPLRGARRAAAVRSPRQLGVLVMGPMAAAAALSAATVADLAPVGDERFAALTAGLAMTAGVAALVAGLLRLGFLAEFISPPVLKGLIIGLALTIIVGQLPKLFGISAGTGDFFEQSWHLVTHLGHTQGPALVVGTCSLAVILGLRRLAPGVPGPLVAVVGAIAAVKVFALSIPTVGSIASGLPSFGLPDIGLADFGRLAGGGLGVMLIAFAEGLGAAKAYAGRDDRRIDASRELVALGGANLAVGVSSGMVVSGSLSKTAVNASAGARTQVSGLLAADVVALLFLTGLFEDLPAATLAAVVIAAMAALLGVTVFGTLPGLFIGIGVSLLRLVYRASRPCVAVLGRTSGQEAS